MIGQFLQVEFEEMIRNKRWEELREAFSELEPADIAEVLEDVPVDEAGIMFRLLPRERAAEVFTYLPVERQEELIHSLSGDQVRGILEEMNPDDRTRLLEEMPAEVTRRLLESLSPEELRQARALLGYPEETAGRFMTPEYVALRPEMTAHEALEYIRRVGRGKESLYVVYVVDERGHLIEDVRLGTLVLANPDQKVGDIGDRALVAVQATDDREEVLKAFERYDRVALPVTDALGHMLGIITVDDILDVAEEEATEDMQKLGGMAALDLPYTSVSLWEMFHKRGVWLSILFVGQLLTATVMERYESALEQVLVLAVFVPLIISSGGNSGSQATSLIIRAMALGQIGLGDWWRVLRREIVVATLLGLGLGVLGLFRVQIWHWLGWYDYGQGGPQAIQIAMIVALALVGVVLWGSVVGAMLPFILRRLGFDPATSSAPFVATLVDVTGLIIYFTVAMTILRGTLS
jgi:magnesium transporter